MHSLGVSFLQGFCKLVYIHKADMQRNADIEDTGTCCQNPTYLYIFIVCVLEGANDYLTTLLEGEQNFFAH